MDITLKYTGPKPLFSSTGISFDNSKQDKYIYISVVCELIFALDHEYKPDTKYTLQTGQKSLDETSALTLIRQKFDGFNEYVDHWREKTVREINEDIKRARNNRFLNDLQKETLINNIEILRSYRIQRTINKSIYYAGISVLSHVILNSKIEYIITPMSPKFLHVLHSIQGSLRKLHPPLESNIDIYLEQGKLENRLSIKRI